MRVPWPANPGKDPDRDLRMDRAENDPQAPKCGARLVHTLGERVYQLRGVGAEAPFAQQPVDDRRDSPAVAHAVALAGALIAGEASDPVPPKVLDFAPRGRGRVRVDMVESLAPAICMPPVDAKTMSATNKHLLKVSEHTCFTSASCFHFS